MSYQYDPAAFRNVFSISSPSSAASGATPTGMPTGWLCATSSPPLTHGPYAGAGTR
jgi:hypothetical protein